MAITCCTENDTYRTYIWIDGLIFRSQSKSTTRYLNMSEWKLIRNQTNSHLWQYHAALKMILTGHIFG